jgi:hypothetical protein
MRNVIEQDDFEWLGRDFIDFVSGEVYGYRRRRRRPL